MKRTTVFLLVLLAVALALLVEVNTRHLKINLPLNFQHTGALASSLNPPAQAPASPSYIVTGKPSISADFINRVLTASHSPAAGTGKALYDLGLQYGIDPVYALAFFWHESGFGRFGMARVTHSLGNLRCIPGFPCVNGYAGFSSWEQGYEAWYTLIRRLYVNRWHKTTIATIIPTYAPSGDGNNVAGYIQAIEQAVNAWRAGKVQV